jgi:hypothetical protein
MIHKNGTVNVRVIEHDDFRAVIFPGFYGATTFVVLVYRVAHDFVAHVGTFEACVDFERAVRWGEERLQSLAGEPQEEFYAP